MLPTVIEPLRAEWNDVRAAALVQLAEAERSREHAPGQAGPEVAGRTAEAV
ncbi:MAG: hypothetical protein U1F23_08055 [Lysobacterales bacterium]